MLPAPTKGVLSRWGRYDRAITAKESARTITMSSTWLLHYNWPATFYYLLRYGLDSNIIINSIVCTSILCKYLKNNKIDLRPLSWGRPGHRWTGQFFMLVRRLPAPRQMAWRWLRAHCLVVGVRLGLHCCTCSQGIYRALCDGFPRASNRDKRDPASRHELHGYCLRFVIPVPKSTECYWDVNLILCLRLWVVLQPSIVHNIDCSLKWCKQYQNRSTGFEIMTL